MLSFYIKEIKAYNGIYEPVNVVGSSGGPLETEAVEHLRGIVVGGLYPSHLVTAAEVIGHERSQQGDEVGILHHLVERLLELIVLHTTQMDAGTVESCEDIGQELPVDIVRMEDDTFLRGGGQQHHGTRHLIDGRELIDVAEGFVGHHSNHHIGSQQREEVIGLEIDLELSVFLSGREVSYSHNLGVQALLGDGVKHQLLGFVLGIDVFVFIDMLSDIEVLFGELDIGGGYTIDTQTCNTGGGDVDESRSCTQTEGDEMSHRLDIHHLDIVACGEMLDIGYAVDDGERDPTPSLPRGGRIVEG